MRSKILLISGTDTGIGKSVFSALLLRNLSARGIRCRALKPIETGCCRNKDGELQALDAELLRAANLFPQPLAETVLHRFQPPVAPLVAARMEGREIHWEDLCRRILVLARDSELLVIEGAGGLLVPITAEKTFADLAKDCGAELILVIGSRLGAINHALLSLELLRSRNIPLLGYVLNEGLLGQPPSAAPKASENQEPAKESNRALLQELAKRYSAKELCAMPELKDMSDSETWLDTWGKAPFLESAVTALLVELSKH